MSLELLDYHRTMICDKVRMGAWKTAIQRAVGAGDTVVDIGAGTGVLTLFACQAGARRVYAIEESAIIEIARKIVRSNGFEDRVIFLNESSNRVALSEPADVLIADLFGCFGLNGNILETMIDARRRLLKPGAACMPGRIELYCAPIELAEWYGDKIESWSPNLGGLDHSAGREYAVNAMHQLRLSGDGFLAEPALLGAVDLAKAQSPDWHGRAELSIERPGMLHGLAGWCRGEYLEGVSVTNSPLTFERTNWTHAVFPIGRPTKVSPCEKVEVGTKLFSSRGRLTWNWSLSGGPPDGAAWRFQHSTFSGELISLESLNAQAPGYRPVASELGRLVRDAIALCDGSRTNAEIGESLSGRTGGDPAAEQTVRDVMRVIRVLCE